MTLPPKGSGNIKLVPQQLEIDVWDSKYRFKRPDGTSDETCIEDSNERVVNAVYAKDKGKSATNSKRFVLEAMNERKVIPAGRQHAGAGTGRKVTLINCYVSPTIEDSMITEGGYPTASEGIWDNLRTGAVTQQMGGGIGMDFSTLRPEGAIVKGIGVGSSGPLYFMDNWDSMCRTIMSAGHRRGAMMATLICHHPDIEKFIVAKREKGRLTNFNVSVLITDKFMEAVKHDLEWHLGFEEPLMGDNPHEAISETNPHTGEPGPWYIYKTVRARDLWDLIMENTYKYAEPGVIFIDRVNKTNNLWYCEEIRATNPCGEQPLPPNGACDLGCINLAKFVMRPFTPQAKIKKISLRQSVKHMVRFLDNVLDVTEYPTEAQRQESMNKRRIGLGVTGLGNMLQQLCLAYGSPEAVKTTNEVMKIIAIAAYRASVNLAKEKGSFPLFDKNKFMQGHFIQKLPKDVQADIRKYGIRNGVLLTVAPVGTTSIYYGNMSSGLEPTFAWHYSRKVRQQDGSFKDYGEVQDYGFRHYKAEMGIPDDQMEGFVLPEYMVTAQDLDVMDHVVMQSAVQQWIDASVSKTINCPPDITFEHFKEVYKQAYVGGCKGCTTYRPSPEGEEIRGSILSTGDVEDKQPEEAPCAPVQLPELAERPEELQGKTYKAKFPGSDHAFYVTINDIVDEAGRRPFEIFINTRDASHQEWVMALTRLLSAIMRRGGDISFLPEELKAIHSSVGGGWLGQSYIPSRVALIGNILEKHLLHIANPMFLVSDEPVSWKEDIEGESVTIIHQGEEQEKSEDFVQEDLKPYFELEAGNLPICPACGAPALVHKEGCETCQSCGYSNCG